MSWTYSIGCVRCKEKLWCGQESAREGSFYVYAEEKADLPGFLRKHVGHELKFQTDFAWDTEEEHLEQSEYVDYPERIVEEEDP